VNNPEDPGPRLAQDPLQRELYIESADFHGNPAPNNFRLKPGGEVRLKRLHHQMR